MVGISGGSGSGKTWLASLLAESLAPGVLRLSMDDFYLDRSHLSARRRAKLNFDHPRAIDWAGVEQVLRELRAGRSTCVPCYDFATHCRKLETKPVFAANIVLLDGLWALQRASVRALLDLRIFLLAPLRLRLSRRLTRDLQSRGRTAASVREQFRRTVEPMHRLFVEPQVKWADIVLRPGWGTFEAEFVAAVIRSIGLKGSGVSSVRYRF